MSSSKTAIPVSSKERAIISSGFLNSVRAMMVDIVYVVMRVINNYIINERFQKNASI
jgi:hypothetical protein